MTQHDALKGFMIDGQYPEIAHIVESAKKHGPIVALDYDPEGGIANRGYLYIVVEVDGERYYNSGSGMTRNGRFEFLTKLSGKEDPKPSSDGAGITASKAGA